MAVRIRLARIGTKNAPVYRIVAIDSKKKRDGAFLENLGTYDPIKGSLVQFHVERVNDWISKGAIPSDAVKKLQKLHGAQ
ncbi:MAG: 30S ribosomal protein S16 [Candidatus Dependentiae bacterium]|nr:30S ribosomal protein S16 [Candidatus Dependentiae bacterium]